MNGSVKPPARSLGPIVYQLKRSLSELSESLRLRNHEWGVLFAITGEHSCAQIGQLLSLDNEERDRVFTRLAAGGLIEERPLNYGEYLRAVASFRDEEPKPLAAFLRGGQAMPRAAAAAAAGAPPAAPPSPRSPAGPGVVSPALPPVVRRPAPIRPPDVLTADSDLNVTRALPTITRQQLIETTVGEALAPTFLPLEPVTALPAPPATARGSLSLKALMQLILGKAADRESGQLDIYRVFIRVNTKLLQRNGITTLRFQDDRLIDDPELQSAITTSFEKALGFPCPPEVFVAV